MDGRICECGTPEGSRHGPGPTNGVAASSSSATAGGTVTIRVTYGEEMQSVTFNCQDPPDSIEKAITNAFYKKPGTWFILKTVQGTVVSVTGNLPTGDYVLEIPPS